MRIDRLALGVVLAALGIAGTAPLHAQDPLTGVNRDTEVRSIGFRFVGPHALDADDLRRRIALTERGGLVWLRNAFGWLPLVSRVGPHPFDPIVLQRDVVRLRRHYSRNGFLHAQIDYDVRYEAEPNLVDITFNVREGPPLVLAALEFVGEEGGDPPVAPELSDEWRGFVGNAPELGRRFTDSLEQALADRTARWLRGHGYPFGLARTLSLVDTAENRAAATVQIRPGMRARISEITVTGNETIPTEHLTRQLPIAAGDWYDAERLERGRQSVLQFDAVRLALFQAPRVSPSDSTVALRLRLTENPPRLIRSEAGVASGAGLRGQTEWTHNTAFGGLRTLTVGAAAHTGLLALESPAREEYRLAVSLFQPYVGDRRLSLGVSPFGEYRNDLRDRSWRVGLQTSLVFSTGPLRSLALGHTYTHRRVLDYGFADELEPAEYLPLLGLAEPDLVGRLGNRFDRSAITLDASWGKLDRFANPRQGYVLRPRIEVTTPFFTSNEYVLLELNATAFVPLSEQVGFTLRAGGGRIYPFGRSVETTGDESPYVSLLRLRDATFTAGGTRHVRGWGTELLGPKLPQVTLQSEAGTQTITADRYSPVGGLARILASTEMHLPIPGFGEAWQSFLFLDGGRIWTPDARLRLDSGELNQERFFLGTGGGVGYETVVGAVQVAVGYKLNPSDLDVRDPEAVARALVEGRPIGEVPTEGLRRWHLHFSIGATF